jgi:hypothetical protein
MHRHETHRFSGPCLRCVWRRRLNYPVASCSLQRCCSTALFTPRRGLVNAARWGSPRLNRRRRHENRAVLHRLLPAMAATGTWHGSTKRDRQKLVWTSHVWCQGASGAVHKDIARTIVARARNFIAQWFARKVAALCPRNSNGRRPDRRRAPQREGWSRRASQLTDSRPKTGVAPWAGHVFRHLSPQVCRDRRPFTLTCVPPGTRRGGKFAQGLGGQQGGREAWGRAALGRRCGCARRSRRGTRGYGGHLSAQAWSRGLRPLS